MLQQPVLSELPTGVYGPTTHDDDVIVQPLKVECQPDDRPDRQVLVHLSEESTVVFLSANESCTLTLLAVSDALIFMCTLHEVGTGILLNCDMLPSLSQIRHSSININDDDVLLWDQHIPPTCPVQGILLPVDEPVK